MMRYHLMMGIFLEKENYDIRWGNTYVIRYERRSIECEEER